MDWTSMGFRFSQCRIPFGKSQGSVSADRSTAVMMLQDQLLAAENVDLLQVFRLHKISEIEAFVRFQVNVRGRLLKYHRYLLSSPMCLLGQPEADSFESTMLDCTACKYMGGAGQLLPRPD